MPGLVLLVGIAVAAVALRLSGRLTAVALALAWGVILLLLAFPDSDLAAGIGVDPRLWVLAGAGLALVLLYRAWLRGLHRRAARRAPDETRADAPDKGPSAPDPDRLSDAELDRYARHLVLREIGGPGQMKLRGARVLVVGAGGLGSPVCLYLAAAGVGHITLADDDVVSLSNLQRQVIYRSRDCGRPKVEAAAEAMVGVNPHVVVTTHPRRVTADDAALVAAHDLVIDGTDSFAGRAEINRACMSAGVPLLAGAIAQWEGQITLYDPARGAPCMACLFPTAPKAGLAPACAEAGVVGALPGVIGSLIALEAIKHLTGAGRGLGGRMMIFDGLHGDTRTIRVAPRPDCAICGADRDRAGPAERLG